MEKRKCVFNICKELFLEKNSIKRFCSLNNIKKSVEPLPLIGKVFKRKMLSLLIDQSLIFASKKLQLFMKIGRPTVVEMELKKEFASLFDVSSNQKTKGPFDLLKNFMALKYLAANSDFCFNNCVFSLDNLASFKSIQINSPVINLDTPPPQFFAI